MHSRFDVDPVSVTLPVSTMAAGSRGLLTPAQARHTIWFDRARTGIRSRGSDPRRSQNRGARRAAPQSGWGDGRARDSQDAPPLLLAAHAPPAAMSPPRRRAA